jgi:hypothetical protein
MIKANRKQRLSWWVTGHTNLILLMVFFALFALTALVAVFSVTKENVDIIAGVISAFSAVVTGFLTYRYAQEDKRIWSKTSDIWDKILSSTTVVVDNFKEMQMVMAGITKIRSSDVIDSRIKEGTILSYGHWMVAEHPEYFRKNDKDIDEVGLAIMQYYYQSQSNQAAPITPGSKKEIDKIGLEVLSILNAHYLRLYSDINQARTTLGVVAFNNEQIYHMITDIMAYLNKTRDDFIDRSLSYNIDYKEKRKSKIDESIALLQSLCWDELEINRKGLRDAMFAKVMRGKKLYAQELLDKERQLLGSVTL